MTEPKVPSRLRLTNPDLNCGNEVERVQADIDRNVFKYFFRQTLAGDRGNRQALIATFFHKLHEACIEAKIDPVYDPDNEHRIAEVLSRINFRDGAAAAKPVAKRIRPART